MALPEMVAAPNRPATAARAGADTTTEVSVSETWTPFTASVAARSWPLTFQPLTAVSTSAARSQSASMADFSMFMSFSFSVAATASA